MLIDTHSHLSFKAYDADRDEVIKRTREAGVVCIDIGTKYETSKLTIELAEKHEGIFASIGMHPIHIKQDLMKIKTDEEEGAFEPFGEEFDKEKYKELAKSKKVVAVGEIGLDYYYKPKTKTRQEAFKQKQKEVFLKQLELAEELNLPVIIHCRSAFDDLYEILKTRKVKGVIHCFTGTFEDAQKYIDLGFYIGINGIIFKLNLDEVMAKTPLEKILLETDCPYLIPRSPGATGTPAAEGGLGAPPAGTERNEPIFVKYVAQKVAEIKKISLEEVAEATTQNARNLFGI